MKPLLTLAAVLTLAAPARAESRSVLIVVTHDKDGKAAVTIHSDDKPDRCTKAPVADACKAVAGMKGWGSVVHVYVVTDRAMARKDRKLLFDAVDDNVWLDLSYYGPEAPKHLADYFLPPAPMKPPAPVKQIKPPAPDPITKVDKDHATKIALAHLNIDGPAKGRVPQFDVLVTEDELTREKIKELTDPRHGVTRHTDAAGLSDTVAVFVVRVVFAKGLGNTFVVYVARDGGRVVLVKFREEG